jgi:hypothetical protein
MGMGRAEAIVEVRPALRRHRGRIVAVFRVVVPFAMPVVMVMVVMLAVTAVLVMMVMVPVAVPVLMPVVMGVLVLEVGAMVVRMHGPVGMTVQPAALHPPVGRSGRTALRSALDPRLAFTASAYRTHHRLPGCLRNPPFPIAAPRAP